MIGCRGVAQFLIFSAFVCPLWAAPQQGLELSLDGTTVKGSRFLISLGIQVDRNPVGFRLTVKNPSASSQALDVFTTGRSIDARWTKPTDKNGLVTRTTIGSGEEQTLDVRVMTNTADSEAPTISVMAGGAMMGAIVISYRVDLAQKTRTTGGEYWTYRGVQFQQMLPKVHYELCTGVAPIGYHLDPASVHIESRTVIGGHPRSCGAWMDCTPAPVTDGNVCYQFAIEGHWKGGDIFHWDDENEALEVAIALQSSYTLDTQKIAIKALTD
jgi:hypothetical protein